MNMKSTLIAILLLVVSYVQSNAQFVAETTTFSLLTGSSGTELYNTFGHSAIRVKDPTKNLDTVFNWGTFDFDAPNFYLNFTRGKLEYRISTESFRSFKRGFVWENRSVVEQKLNLTLEQKRRLYQQLIENYKPENRYYKYDFFFDNCATRIRDLMITTFGNDFQYNYPEEWKTSGMTFRNLIDLYLTAKHWSDFGIDLALGLPTDDVASPADYMFLPEFMEIGFEKATIIHNGIPVPFTKTTELIIPRKDIAPKFFFITPLRLMWSLFILALILSYFSYKKALKIHWFDVFYFSVIGLVGWVVFFLWFLTDHIATKDNLNLLWAVPLYMPIFFFWHKLAAKTRKWAIIILGGINLIILLTWVIFPQNYHLAFIPLILIILMRFFFFYRTVQDEL